MFTIAVDRMKAMRRCTNALPDISRALRVRDTAARRALGWLAGHQTIVKPDISSAEDIHFSALFADKHILELVYERWLPPEVADRCAFEIRALASQGGIDESNACIDVLHAIAFVKTNFCAHPPPIEDESTDQRRSSKINFPDGINEPQKYGRSQEKVN